MRKLTGSYDKNKKIVSDILRVDANFDVLCKKLCFADSEASFFYIDGFVKDTVMQKLMMHFLSLKRSPKSAEDFASQNLPYVEVEVVSDLDIMINMVLSGATLMLSDSFGAEAVIIDTRTYPARNTEEPEGDRVMRGARDGFVETLIFNTTLIRRRIRNPALTMRYFSIGKDSKSDVVLCFMSDRADLGYVEKLSAKLRGINTDSLVMGHESLKECLIKSR